VLALNLMALLSSISERISEDFLGVRYIEPLRATATRYYRLQDLGVDEIDSQGRNLPMFIDALSGQERRDFEAWTEEHFSFRVTSQRHAGHLSLQITESGLQTHNLADSGFGYSQILPIATQLWRLGRTGQSKLSRRSHAIGKFFVVEQPELHLHPRLQARLADVFAAAIGTSDRSRSPLRIVAETHSEALVNRLGVLIAEGKLTSEDVNVVLFDRKDPDGPAGVRCVRFDKKGYLQNWPYGFLSAASDSSV